MESTITERELAGHLTETLERVRARGESITIDRDGEPIAVLAPAPARAAITWHVVARGLPEIGFPGDGFADDVETAQAVQPRLDPPAWPS